MYIFLGVVSSEDEAEALIERDENGFYLSVCGAFFVFTWRSVKASAR